ncbi:MAG TPA: hypothetical protein VNS46_10800 [Nocardioides sp.]|nr:hypothetical protein [Nocardioides sp.]
MRPIARSFAAAAAVALLGLGLSACGGEDDAGGDDGTPSAGASSGATASSDGADGTAGADSTAGAATDGSGASSVSPQPADSELCSALSGIIEVVDPIEGPPDEDQWGEIQERYAALGEVGLPDGTPARLREGRDASVEAITSLTYAEAERAFGNKGGEVPGLSQDENRKAAEFFNWAGQQCPSVLGTADAEASSVTTQ